METEAQAQQIPFMVAVVEDPDGLTFHQRIPNDFYSLLDYKKSLGQGYWIVDLYDT